ncbi:hypothetical protein BDM02DRAFT_3154894 [Thelephora ganbajun]|uniref:Uncharacterized protein n=1 Tax=Thelephora ganbajun TaxID=370292 RepID=A0ACB6ZL89_THEGA|nr:hypothetical protein BDM02DRAFT_3154894 [Thelephora ganbajun]
MTLDSAGPNVPQDLVSIFHCSFHPTKGNIIDWALKTNPDLDLTNVEFSSLPSGLHLVEEDVVYFTKGGHQGVSIFRRRETSEEGHRGFRLSSLGVLVAKSPRPRPWRHVLSLKSLIRSMYSRFKDEGIYDPGQFDWSSAESFFEQRKNSRTDSSDSGVWRGWSDELDLPDPDFYNPTTHLPHLLRILGLSTITLYKHILGRRRILIYTLPPVEASGILCQVAADMVDGSSLRLKGRTRESIRVLGMVTLSDLDMLQSEENCRRGWVACTTDAIYLEKPSFYDLVIDLTTSTPYKTGNPTLYLSRPTEWTGDGKARRHKLSPVRFTWSDLKVWAELERLLARHVTDDRHCCEPHPKATVESPSSWTGIWRVYEDVCITCAGIWLGTWRNNSVASYSTVNGNMANWGQVRLEGDEDLSVGGSYVRNLGMGIEGRPAAPSDLDREVPGVSGSSKATKRTSGMSVWSKFTNRDANDRLIQFPSDEEDARLRKHEQQVLLTLALLQTFHAHTTNLLSKLAYHLPSAPGPSSGGNLSTIYLSPRDLYAFELGPLSGLDAQFIEWLGEEYGSRVGVRVVVRRGWRDLIRVIFGL